MNEKRKKIYIGVITFCLIVTGGMLFYAFSGNDDNAPLPQLTTPATGTPASAQQAAGAPVVFPRDNKFDISIFESSKYKTLKPGRTITIEEQELGRDNPFAKY